MLAAVLAARTDRIRLGSGGVLLTNHQPLVVAEQFAALAAAYPSRIDLGVGQASAVPPSTAAALGGDAPGTASRSDWTSCAASCETDCPDVRLWATYGWRWPDCRHPCFV